MTPDEDVEDVPLIRPCASRQVVFVPLMLEVPVTLPWASLKVVLEPDVLVVVVDLPFWSLRLAFLPARDEAGSAKAKTGSRRARINFMAFFLNGRGRCRSLEIVCEFAEEWFTAYPF